MAENSQVPNAQNTATSSARGSSLDRVLAAAARLGLRVRTGKPTEAFISCPLHEDKSPSVHVTWKSASQGGFVLMYCHSCQGKGADLVEPMGLTGADLYDEPMPDRLKSFDRVGKSPSQRLAAKRRSRLGRLPNPINVRESVPEPDHVWVEVERYPYVNLEDRLVQEVIRCECTAEGQRHKSFRQVFITDAGRQVKTKPRDFESVLYRAPQVSAAVREGRTVWVLEGEKDVHAAEGLGLVATTNTNGGTSFPDQLVDALAGADIVAVLDRDDVGWARGLNLHHKLTAVDAKIRLKLPLVADAKADFSDHINAGHSVEAFVDVTVDELATWDALSAVKTARKQLEDAVLEAEAHQQLASINEGASIEEHRQYAKRWAAAVEVWYETLHAAGDKVYGLGCRAGTPWAGEAMQLSDDTVVSGAELSRRCLLAVGAPVPPCLRLASPAEQVDPESEGQKQAAGKPADEQPFGTAGAGASSTVFRILGGQIVQWEPSRRKDDEDADGRYKVLLSTVVRITAREFLEVDSDDEDDDTQLMGRESSANHRKVSAPRKLAAMRLEYADQATGELMEIRIQADAWRDHSWIAVSYTHLTLPTK